MLEKFIEELLLRPLSLARTLLRASLLGLLKVADEAAPRNPLVWVLAGESISALRISSSICLPSSLVVR